MGCLKGLSFSDGGVCVTVDVCIVCDRRLECCKLCMDQTSEAFNVMLLFLGDCVLNLCNSDQQQFCLEKYFTGTGEK